MVLYYFFQLKKPHEDEEENEDFIDILRSLANEVETRGLTVESLNNQIQLGKTDLAPKEFNLLVGNVEKLTDSTNQLSVTLNELIKQESDGAKVRKLTLIISILIIRKCSMI